MSYTPLTHFLRVVTTPLIQRLSAQLLPASGVRMYGCILNNKQSATPSPIMSLRNGQVPKSLPRLDKDVLWNIYIQVRGAHMFECAHNKGF